MRTLRSLSQKWLKCSCTVYAENNVIIHQVHIFVVMLKTALLLSSVTNSNSSSSNSLGVILTSVLLRLTTHCETQKAWKTATFYIFHKMNWTHFCKEWIRSYTVYKNYTFTMLHHNHLLKPRFQSISGKVACDQGSRAKCVKRKR